MLKQIVRNIRTSRYLNKRKLVLLYHYVGDPPGMLSRSHLHFTQSGVFEQHIRSLQKKYSFVFVDELIASKEHKHKLASITFDDGYRSVFTEAFPVLQKLGVPATIFINSERVKGKSFWRDKVRMLIERGLVQDFLLHARLQNVSVSSFYKDSKDPAKITSIEMEKQLDDYFTDRNLPVSSEGLYCDLRDLRELSSSDFIMLGNHSMNHYVLATLNREEQGSEILGCKNFLEQNFRSQKISSVFSIPFGGKRTYNQWTMQALNETGYQKALMSETGKYLRQEDIVQNNEGLVFCNRYMPMNQLRIMPSLMFD